MSRLMLVWGVLLARHRRDKHKSFGMKVTADRIRMINQLYSLRTQAHVVDLVDSFGEPCGTNVILEIPV